MKINSKRKKQFTQRYSVMVIPETHKKIFQFEVRYWTVITVALLLVILLLSAGTYTWLLKDRVSNLEQIIAQDTIIQQKQIELSTRLDNMQQNMDAALHTYEQLFQKENEIRGKLGMDLLQGSEFAIPTGLDLSETEDRLTYMETAGNFIKDKLVILTANQQTINQKTEELLQMQAAYIPKGFPLDTMSKILYSFGTADENGNIHQGFGLEAYEQGKVLASASGMVAEIGDLDDSQKMIKVDHGNGYITIYIFKGKSQVNVGDGVTKGTIIGAIEGVTDSPLQLEFQVIYQGQYVNPETLLQISG